MMVPHAAARYFWGDNLQELNPQKHARYVAQTLLERGDVAAVRWLFSIFAPKTIQQMLPYLKLSRRSGEFWRVYLS